VILVTVGTTHFQFDRLITAVATLDAADEIVVQRGPSQVTVENARIIDFLSFAELDDLVLRSRVVVMHAGVGSILVALSHGKKPIVVPRLARFGEAVDDHQVQVAAMLAEQGRVTALHEPSGLGDAVASASVGSHSGGLFVGPLVDVLADEVARAISR
jgi:UDP-N-acetylglucosamine transferase subunit ALG13